MEAMELNNMKSTGRNGILLSGYFGCGNLGDDLLLSTALEHLRTISPGALFLIRDCGDVAHLRDLGPNVAFTGLETILANPKQSRARRLTSFLVRLAGLLRRSRWLVFAGGSVFHEHGGLDSLLIQWAMCRLARLLRVRIAALGVGVSDMHSSTGRFLLRDIVAMSELFLVRDEAALRQCADTQARLTDDLVFAWRSLARPPSTSPRSPGRAGGGATIALAVCAPAFEGRAEERAVAAFSEAVRLWHSHGHRVVFFSFLKAGVTPGDQTMLARIAQHVSATLSVETRALLAEPSVIAAAYRDIDLLCGMRFHGFVLAALLGIPFVGLAHENKISEICRRFGMRCLDASAFDGAALASAAEAALNRRPDPQLVERSIVEAHRNFRAFADLL